MTNNFWLDKHPPTGTWVDPTKRLLAEAKELEKHWDSRMLGDIDGFSRIVTSVMLESQRLTNECWCEVCEAKATYIRRNPSFEYFCEEHAPEDATSYPKEKD